MSSFHRAALAIVVAAGPYAAAASPSIPPADLKAWNAEATDFGHHPQAAPAHPPGYYDIGTTPDPAAVAGWSITIMPTGAGLPPGQGTVAEGEALYGSLCAACHGTFAQGRHGYPALVGGVGSLASASPARTLGSYWPFATTVWDYIDRAMPFYAPHTLKPEQVYALTAYLLDQNGIVPTDFIANPQTIPAVKMPDRTGWTWIDPRPVTHAIACMKHCATPGSIEITSNAETTHLTPRLTGKVDHMKAAQ